MATSMLRTSCCSCSSRLSQCAVIVTCRRYTQEVSEGEDSVKPVLYPIVRGKYPRGSAENGTGWEGLTPREAWKWDKQRRLIECYRGNLLKKLSFVAKKPIKTWKFPSVQWGSGNLDYMGDRTKSNIIQDSDFLDTLDAYQNQDEGLQRIVKKLAPIVLDTIRLEHRVNRTKLEQRYQSERGHVVANHYNTPDFENIQSNLKTKNILNTILNAAQSGMCGNCSHLKECAVDEKVPVSAQWSRYGVQRHPPFKRPVTATELPNNALFYGKHIVEFQIRTHFPLEEFYDRENTMCRQCTYPKSPYKPTALGQKAESMQRYVSPGFHPGAPYEFIHTSIVQTDKGSLARAIKEFGDVEPTTIGYALATNFFAAVSMAHMQGFNMLSELKYPFTTQAIVTNGQKYYFSAYQLNTLHMWRSDTGNNRQNLFWISEPHTLYDVNEDGTIESVNEDTLKKILKVILLPTSTKREKSLSPHLPNKKPPATSISMRIPKIKKVRHVAKKKEIY